MARPGAGWVLKFISGKYQGGEFRLETNREVIVGRASDAEMVLVEDMVSRQHARFSTSDSEVWIEDFGSTNGTFVNGEKVTRVRLKEGDRILIGTSIIKLAPGDEAPAVASSSSFGQRHGQSDAPPPVTMMGQQNPRGTAPGNYPPPAGVNRVGPTTQAIAPLRSLAPAPQPAAPAPAAGVLTGQIDQVPLPDLLQLFGNAKKSGCLIINTPHSEGRIYMREGRVYAALIDNNGDVPMDKSFYRMMSWTTGSFLLDANAKAQFENEINESIESLMMEGMRILDEIRNLGADVPDFASHIIIPTPLVPPLRNLTPELLDTLQLVHNYRHLETVLNKSLASDLETLQDVLYLLRNRYLAVEE